ncbi:MAG: histidine kinase, partial [Deltaproteobacteria bacterium]|nr:histidine kinase [Deltaproteobacteria bacterium]
LRFSWLGRQSMKHEAIDTDRLVREALADMSSQIEGRRVDVRIAELVPCNGDPALLKQVWLNLLSNALKYTRTRNVATIEIGCTRRDGETVYFVCDNGVGFDMQQADKLFGVFQRLHPADEFEGTGVGLAIVQRVVHRHGGQVWADAAEGCGATFFFTLSDPSASRVLQSA